MSDTTQREDGWEESLENFGEKRAILVFQNMVGAEGLEPATLSSEDSVSIENREHMRSRR